MQAQAAVPARAHQLLAVRLRKLPAWKNQGFREAVWHGLALGVCKGSLDEALHLGRVAAPEGSSWRPGWLSNLSPSQSEPLALLSQPVQGWLAPRAGCSPSQTAGPRVPAHVSLQLLPSDAVWAGVTLSAAVTPAKHHQRLHKRRRGGWQSAGHTASHSQFSSLAPKPGASSPVRWHFCPLQPAGQRMGSSMSPRCPFGQEMPEKGNAAQGEFHAGTGGLKGD